MIGWILAVVSILKVSHGIDFASKVVCVGNNLNIRCFNSSYGVVIHDAQYGRTRPGSVVCKYEGSDRDWRYICPDLDVTSKLRHICKAKRKKCEVRVGKKLFGEPCGKSQTKPYLSVIYSCVKRKRSKKPITDEPPEPTKSTLAPTTLRITTTTELTDLPNRTLTNASHVGPITNIPPTKRRITHAPTRRPTTPTQPSETVVLFQGKKDKNGFFFSIILWFLFVKENFSAFLRVFLISMVAATAFFSVLFGFFAIRSYVRAKQKDREAKLNGGPHHNTNSTLNSIQTKNSKDTTDSDRLSMAFPPPPPALAPLPDDVMYPSPQSTISCSRPPPPPKRGFSTDDVGRMGLESPKFRNVPLKRSISLRTKDNYAKELKFDRLPDVEAYRDIQAVIIQRNNGSTMYMNPMYENGVLVKEAKM